MTYHPIDVESITRRALRGWGPEDPEPVPVRASRRSLSMNGLRALRTRRALGRLVSPHVRRMSRP
jgi:hypothetical protein